MHKLIFIAVIVLCTMQCSEPIKEKLPAPTSKNAIHLLKEMNTQQIKNLNKNKTVVLLPGGILEEHGPYLPNFTDGYWNEKLTDTIANELSAKGWEVLIFPTIPLGNSGANDIGSKYSYPGTYTVSFETLRRIFMDLAIELGEQGFKNIFIIHSHGAPNHQRALDQASLFFNETYQGKMVNLMGINALQLRWFDSDKTEEQQKEDGMKMHAGMQETSAMLFIDSSLVDDQYKNAKAFSGNSMSELITIARDSQWQGYFGSERIASGKFGKEAWRNDKKECLKYVFAILENKIDPDTLEKFGDFMMTSPEDVALDKLSLKEEKRRKDLQLQWLRKKRLDTLSK